MPVAPKVLPFWAARLGGAILTGSGFFVMVAIFIAPVVFSRGDRIGTELARWLSWVVLSAMPSFGLLTAATSMLDAYALGKFDLPPSAAGEISPAGAVNPWRGAMIWFALLGVPLASAVFAWISRAWPEDGVSPWNFVWLLSGSAGALTALATYERSGRFLLREIAVPFERRRFPGSARAYLWQRHAVPQFVLNGWFNAWAAFSMIEGPVSDPASSISRSDILLEAAVTSVLIAIGIAFGSRGYATFDLRWGVAPRLPHRAPSGLRIGALLLAGTTGAWLLLGLSLFALDIERVSTLPLVVARGVLYGGFSGTIGYWSARWTLSTAQAERADLAPARAA